MPIVKTLGNGQTTIIYVYIYYKNHMERATFLQLITVITILAYYWEIKTKTKQKKPNYYKCWSILPTIKPSIAFGQTITTSRAACLG